MDATERKKLEDQTFQYLQEHFVNMTETQTKLIKKFLSSASDDQLKSCQENAR